MNYQIKSGLCSAEISALGAELKSFKNNKTQTEYIWYGKPEFWYGTAPILFPIVGKLKDDEYIYEGKTYKMNQHGFARKSEFELKEKTDNSLLFVLRPSAETRTMFPFEFELEIGFEINENKLLVSNKVINPSDRILYFTIGAHPAFNLPLSNASLEDYYIEFDKNEDLELYSLEGGLLLKETTKYILNEGNRIRLSETVFNNDALVFKSINSHSFTIGNTKSDYKLKLINTGNAPHLGIWSKPGAPYVCIEPWHGHADFVDTDKDFVKKEGMIKLGKKEVFETSYELEV